eukprot:358881-Chlamydomonas_euryale.AAC.5
MTSFDGKGNGGRNIASEARSLKKMLHPGALNHRRCSGGAFDARKRLPKKDALRSVRLRLRSSTGLQRCPSSRAAEAAQDDAPRAVRLRLRSSTGSQRCPSSRAAEAAQDDAPRAVRLRLRSSSRLTKVLFNRSTLPRRLFSHSRRSSSAFPPSPPLLHLTSTPAVRAALADAPRSFPYCMYACGIDSRVYPVRAKCKGVRRTAMCAQRAAQHAVVGLWA